jgi:hypothetical protein
VSEENNESVMALIMYDRAIDEEVIDALIASKINFYSKWREVVGVGRHDPHLGDHIWPGLNNAIMVVIDKEKKRELFNKIQALQDRYSAVGLRAFVIPVLEIV